MKTAVSHTSLHVEGDGQGAMLVGYEHLTGRGGTESPTMSDKAFTSRTQLMEGLIGNEFGEPASDPLAAGVRMGGRLSESLSLQVAALTRDPSSCDSV